ncbi:hypothetical protein INT43_000075 [Umbelopsis isabellina]|uniref:Uncharacterized protein n=1 Tax=Mortierella isabellina TaxID=91625 RepID=A0A8H7PF19_MORIS|nr:hypothetical protein INT43_000075 [Umbelopsis isabellina]
MFDREKSVHEESGWICFVDHIVKMTLVLDFLIPWLICDQRPIAVLGTTGPHVQDKIGGSFSLGFFGDLVLVLVFDSEEPDLVELFDEDSNVFFSEDDDFLNRGI